MAQRENRYINVLTDYGFKKVFRDKEVMTAFLTDLLQPKSPIQDITFLDKEHDGMAEYERGVIYDLLCQTEDGEEFIVEIRRSSATVSSIISRAPSPAREKRAMWPGTSV